MLQFVLDDEEMKLRAEQLMSGQEEERRLFPSLEKVRFQPMRAKFCSATGAGGSMLASAVARVSSGICPSLSEALTFLCWCQSL